MLSMKNFSLTRLSLLCMSTLILTSCDSDDDATPDFEGETIEYELQPEGDAAVDGTVTFTENENGSTTVEIITEGTEEGETYSAQLLHGDAAEEGELAFSLEDLVEGKSTTSLSTLEDDSEVTFEDLKTMDGHIVIYLVGEETDTPVASANIGANAEE